MKEKKTKGLFYGLIAIFGGAVALLGQLATDRKINEEVDKILKERETSKD